MEAKKNGRNKEKEAKEKQECAGRNRCKQGIRDFGSKEKEAKEGKGGE